MTLQKFTHSRCCYRLLAILGFSRLFGSGTACAQFMQAPVEVRVLTSPQAVSCSDGLIHLAYELHVTNFYQSTGPLRLRRLAVFAGGSNRPLASFTAAQVNDLLAHPATGADSVGVTVEAGKRVVLFLWLTLPSGKLQPQALRHQLEFETATGTRQLVDGVPTPLNPALPLVLGAPLRSGTWLAHEGPGNHFSHHWGGLVAINGQVTIPQRYAIDFFGLDVAGHAVHTARSQVNTSANTDWTGFGTEVLAVADGIVRDMRDGEPNHQPFASLQSPTDLTERTLMGNFVVLEIAPSVFVHYAHLLPGSLTVKVGDRLRKGTVLGRLGQSGSSNAPHLHFQVTTAATFEGSEGVPYTFQSFDLRGSVKLADVLDQAVKVSLSTNAKHAQQEVPLDGDVIIFK